MKHFIKPLSALLLATTIITGCNTEISPQAPRAVYHWKTTFDADSFSQEFIKKQKIGRIYLRMFDVDTEYDIEKGTYVAVPIATTRFETPIPPNVEVIPVTYITLNALKAMIGNEAEYAELLTERLLAMCSYNECGKIKEVQIDCDWTQSTKKSYSKLCKNIKDRLNDKEIELSITIRLHQLKETPPSADKGVLMLYNTGNLKSVKTKNSILDLNDVRPYIKKCNYPIPLAYAYPTFGWGVKFDKEENFVAIVGENTTDTLAGEHIRRERPTAEEILEVKKLVERKLGKPKNGNIIYHLDKTQLKNYTNDEINQILSL